MAGSDRSAGRRLARKAVAANADHRPPPGRYRQLGPRPRILNRSTIEVFPQASDDVEFDTLLQREIIERLQVLSRLESFRVDPKTTEAPIVLTTLAALMHFVPSPDAIRRSRQLLRVGERHKIEKLRLWLIDAGYHTTTSVQLPGEFTFRGGILDVFPPDSPEPIRIEWFDDEIESIRMFDAMTQKSIDRMDSIALPPAKGDHSSTASLLDYLDPSAAILVHEPESSLHTAHAFLERIPFPERFAKPEQVMEAIRFGRHAELVHLPDPAREQTVFRIPLGESIASAAISSRLRRRSTRRFRPDDKRPYFVGTMANSDGCENCSPPAKPMRSGDCSSNWGRWHPASRSFRRARWS